MSKTSLSEFLDFIGQIDDDEMLEIAESLLLDIVEIERKREQIETLEAGLAEGAKMFIRNIILQSQSVENEL